MSVRSDCRDRFGRYRLWATTLDWLLRYPFYGGRMTYDPRENRDPQAPESTGGDSADLYGRIPGGVFPFQSNGFE